MELLSQFLVRVDLDTLRGALDAHLVPNAVAAATAAGVLLAAIAALHLLERKTGRFIAHRWGWRGILVTGWLGVPIHELSHLVMARLFSHRIIGWSLFDPDPSTGTLGYVRHAYRRRNLWQLIGQFFVGVAPLFGGCIALGLLLWSMTTTADQHAIGRAIGELQPLGSPRTALTDSWALLVVMARSVWSAREPWLPLQIYACVAVSSHMAPSPRDLEQGWWGAILAATVVTSLVVGASAFGVSLTGLPALAGPVLAAVLIIGAFVTLWVAVTLLLAPSPSRGCQMSSPQATGAE